jgi:hypothetical protein
MLFKLNKQLIEQSSKLIRCPIQKDIIIYRQVHIHHKKGCDRKIVIEVEGIKLQKFINVIFQRVFFFLSGSFTTSSKISTN